MAAEPQTRPAMPTLAGEDPATESAGDARAWIDIYTRLTEFNEEVLGRAEPGRCRQIERDLAIMRERLAFWRDRHRRLVRLELDQKARLLHGAGGSRRLTPREAELLTFFLSHPERWFSPGALATRAWRDSGLSAEQVRSYVVHLRRLLEQTGVPCRILTERGRGYRMVFTATD
jgi:hypothetical protein